MAKTVKLFGQELEVFFSDKKTLKSISGSKDTIGYFDPNTLRIYLYFGLQKEQMQKVFLHELMHASLMLSGLEKLLDDKHQEALCDLVENWQTLFYEEIDQLLRSKPK